MLPTFKNQRRLKGATIALALALPLVVALSATTPSSAQTAPAAPRKAVAAPPLPVAAPKAAPPERPTRWVAVVTPKIEMWPDQMEAQGNVMPWQETRVGTEIGGLRLVSVMVNAGDVVKKGQVLARLNPVTVETELEAANAQLMEAQAALAQAEATLDRGKRLAPSGGVSQQELTLYETQKQTAAARVNAARAQVKTQQLRLDSATLVAPDDGVISSRLAVEGAIVQAGSELFRLIRQGRLEWRAEVKGETLLKLRVGQQVTVKSPLGPEVEGHVRQVSPTIDLTTRNGLVYVDLPLDTNLKAGLNVSGTLTLSKRKALIVPAAAVLHEGATARVFKVNAESRIEVVDVQIGRVRDAFEEITAGLDVHSQVIAKDVELLKAGDRVRVQTAQDGDKLTAAPAEANTQ
jgi:HlyD family secretion protein